MIFTCSQAAMSDAISAALRAVTPKSPNLILEGVRVRAAGNKAVLFCTDSEIGIECSVSADVVREGEAVVNARLFNDIVRSMPDTSVRFETVDEVRMKVVSGDSVFELYIIQTDAFPEFPEFEQDNVFTVDQANLRRLFAQTVFAVGVDETRKPLTGLLLESDEGVLNVVGVDGYRIALRKEENKGSAGSLSLIVPSRSVSELVKIIPQEAGELNLYAGRGQAVVAFGGCRMFTRLIDGEFLNYKYIIPDGFVTQAVVSRAMLLESVERAALILNFDNYRKYPVILQLKDGRMTVRAMSELGTVEEDILVADHQGDNMEVAFNPRFLIDALRAADDNEVLFRFTTKVGQCVIRPINNDRYVYLILPVRVGTEA